MAPTSHNVSSLAFGVIGTCWPIPKRFNEDSCYYLGALILRLFRLDGGMSRLSAPHSVPTLILPSRQTHEMA